jgi:hypothetical protein
MQTLLSFGNRKLHSNSIGAVLIFIKFKIPLLWKLYSKLLKRQHFFLSPRTCYTSLIPYFQLNSKIISPKKNCGPPSAMMTCYLWIRFPIITPVY